MESHALLAMRDSYGTAIVAFLDAYQVLFGIANFNPVPVPQAKIGMELPASSAPPHKSGAQHLIDVPAQLAEIGMVLFV